MRNKKYPFLIGSLAILGLVLGYAINDALDSELRESNLGSREAKSWKRSESHGLRGGTVSRSQAKRELLNPSSIEQWLNLYTKIEEFSLDELYPLVVSAEGNNSLRLAIVQYWLEQDSQHFFETLLGKSKDPTEEGARTLDKGLSRLLFDYWREHDLDAAIAALSRPEGLPGRQSERSSLLQFLMVSDPKRSLELSAKWGEENSYLRGNSTKKWAQKNPRLAAETVLENAIGEGAQSQIKEVAKVWAQSDPEEALQFMGSRTGRLSQVAQETILAEWARQDYEAASGWLGAQDDYSLQSRLTPQLVGVWAEEDPAEAWRWSQENLDEGLLAKVAPVWARAAASKDVAMAAEMVQSMEHSAARTQAGVVVAKAWFPRSDPSSIKVTPEAIAWLEGFDDLQIQGDIVSEISWGWSRQHRESLLSFLSRPSSVKVSNRVYERVSDDWAQEAPESVLQWAGGLPEERAELVTNRTFATWLKGQPGSAKNWFRNLSATDKRRGDIVQRVVMDSLTATDHEMQRQLSILDSNDVEFAKETLEEANFSEEKKQRVTDFLED